MISASWPTLCHPFTPRNVSVVQIQARELPCPVLPDKVCYVGGTYYWFLPGATGTNDIIDSQYLFLFVLCPHFPLLF